MTAQAARRCRWRAIIIAGAVVVCPAANGQDASTGSPSLRAVLTGHTNDVRSIAVTRDGRTLVSGGDDMTVKVWDVAASKERATLRGHQERIEFVGVEPDGLTVASADREGAIKLWDVAAGRMRVSLTRPARRSSLVAMTLSADGRTLVTVGQDNLIRLWDVAAGELQASVPSEVNRYWSQAISPDAKAFAWGDRKEGRRLRLLDLPSGAERGLPWEAKDIAPQVFSADGRTLVIIIHSEDTIQLREVATGRVRAVIRDVKEGDLESLAMHPGGCVLAWSYKSTGRATRLW